MGIKSDVLSVITAKNGLRKKGRRKNKILFFGNKINCWNRFHSKIV